MDLVKKFQKRMCFIVQMVKTRGKNKYYLYLQDNECMMISENVLVTMREENRMVSMKDIAAACGVSVATVSKALNDYSDIGKKTREQVRETAKQMGYFPNSSARALKTKRTYNLGVLFTDEANSGLTHDFFAHVLESFKVAAEARGYDITFTNCNASATTMSYLEHCRYRGVDGVVLACIDFFDPAVQELIMSDLPLVTIDHIFDNRASISSDNVKGMHDLVEYILEKGHRKIAYIHGADSSVTRARLSSFYHTLTSWGVNVPEAYVLESPYRDVPGAEAQTRKLMELPDPPTCILYPDDLSCIGGMNALNTMGYRIGTDISIAGYDGIAISRLLSPMMTTIRQDTENIGKRAAEKLIELIESPKSTIVDHGLVCAQLQKGCTVADLNAR